VESAARSRFTICSTVGDLLILSRQRMSQPTKNSAAKTKSAFQVSFEIPKKSWNVLTGKTTSIVIKIPAGVCHALLRSILSTASRRHRRALSAVMTIISCFKFASTRKIIPVSAGSIVIAQEQAGGALHRSFTCHHLRERPFERLPGTLRWLLRLGRE